MTTESECIEALERQFSALKERVGCTVLRPSWMISAPTLRSNFGRQSEQSLS
jgi:hypothetical protein